MKNVSRGNIAQLASYLSWALGVDVVYATGGNIVEFTI